MKTTAYVFVGVLVLVALAVGAWFWWHTPAGLPAPEAAPVAAAPAPSPVAPVASSPGIRHPIEAPVSTGTVVAPVGVEAELTNLFGRKSVLAMFELEDFPRRVVATVDNLGRERAPARLWPVHPTEGRLTVEQQGDDVVIGSDNGLRYTPFVLLVETVDMRQVVAAYTRLYTVFQQAYEDLGFPRGYFNDRLVEVIDLLLATPDVNVPVKVHLPAVNGPFQPKRPWLLYEFDDPALETLTAGQKILLRMGPLNEHRMKAKLAEIRGLLARPAPAR